MPQPYVIIALNSAVRVARTRPKPGPDPVWDEEFALDELPADVTQVTLNIHNTARGGKSNARGLANAGESVAELTLDLATLGCGEEREQWYTLAGVTPMGEWGSLRLRTRYLHDLVMPAEEYSPLRELLLEPGLHAVRALADTCHADRQPLAQALLRVFSAEGREPELLRELLASEVARETDTSTLFRAASLPTALMDLYMRAECTGFLHAAVLETVLRLHDSKQSAELNPAKMDSPEEACQNAEFLLQLLDQVRRKGF